MENRLKKPCNDCPFRRNAVAGWLGGGDPESFVVGALADGHIPADDDWETTGAFIEALPCHQTVDYENPRWRDTLEEVDACVGALQFCANTFKHPREERRAELVSQAGKNPDVFSTPTEFITYHRASSAHSWEER